MAVSSETLPDEEVLGSDDTRASVWHARASCALQNGALQFFTPADPPRGCYAINWVGQGMQAVVYVTVSVLPGSGT